MDPHVFDEAARITAYGVAAGILVNVLDDAFVDARYLFGRLGARSRRVLDRDRLMSVVPKRVAIMLPAWKEAEVIEQMVAHNLARLDYPRDRVDFFVGTYCNDADTQARVEAAARRFPNVHKVVVPHDGPTSKADCLNWIYQGVVLVERERSRRFDILLMHDAEDVIHPLALRLYSLLVPEHELVQTPVFSLPLPMHRLVAGTYIDEFAEHHQKDMRVREAIGGMVPSAGVGTAFDRAAFEEIALAADQRPFNVDSLTEDYEIGLKFRLSRRKAHFAFCSVLDDHGREDPIATREYFPSGMGASIRQRSRWILGITLQTWEQVGWPGSWPVLYCLWRDRKAILTNLLLLCAYALLLYFLSRLTAAQIGYWAWNFDDVVPPGSALTWVLRFNFAFAGWRMVMKAFFVGRLYGPWHAALSVPRIFLANVIGISATARAAWQYARHRWSGEPLRWLKTAHEFPTADRIAVQRGLGEYLLAEHAITEADLREALALQEATGRPIEDVLTAAGIASESSVIAALAAERDMASAASASLDPRAVDRALLERLPEDVADDLDVLPLSEDQGRVVVATSQPLEPAERERLEGLLGAKIEERLAHRDSLAPARARAYRRLVSEPPPSPSSPSSSSSSSSPAPPSTSGADSIGQLAAVDRHALGRLGVGFCAFHGVVPTKLPGGKPRLLATAPLHPSVLATIGLRLGYEPVVRATSAGVALRLALASVEGAIPTLAVDAGLFGLDAVEVQALRDEVEGDVAEFARDARERGLSPLEWFEESHRDDPSAVARVRARTFGLPLSNRGTLATGLLPPRLAHEHDVTLVAREGDLVALAAPRPTPRLAQEVASLLAPLRVAWSVTPA